MLMRLRKVFLLPLMQRAMFGDKFLLWKVFPICCLRWILQFSVLKCPPCSNASIEERGSAELLDTLQHLVVIWSKREFVQSMSMEQRVYVTAAVGLSLEKMSKEKLETTKDTLHSLLQGVSCRLESPIHLVRKIGSSVALVFSKTVDPKNPLYLDEDSKGEIIDREFGVSSLQKKVQADSHSLEITKDESRASKIMLEGSNGAAAHRRRKDEKSKTSNADGELSGFKLVDPDEIIDPATLNNENFIDEEDDDDESSSVSSDSSLQP